MKMLNKFNIEEWADKYYNNNLSEKESQIILSQLAHDPILKKEWEQALDIYRLLYHKADKEFIAQTIAKANAPATTYSKIIQLVKNNWKPSAIAASVAIACTMSINAITSRDKKDTTTHHFTQLSRDIENIKHHQNALLKNIQEVSSANTVAKDNYKMGGTGFAISNDGYIATNYHVIKDANNITITNVEQKDFNAIVVGYDLESDIAILKIVDKHFKFSDNNLPYTIAKNNHSTLGLKVYTLGYPQEELVYNEGYVSCQNGYEGDSLSYQLEIVSNPGQSGSPILDKEGNIWGLINGKSSNTSGTTYAIKSAALIDLIKNLPEHYKISIPKNNNKLAKLSRVQQVAILQKYVVSIKTSK